MLIKYKNTNIIINIINVFGIIDNNSFLLKYSIKYAKIRFE